MFTTREMDDFDNDNENLICIIHDFREFFVSLSLGGNKNFRHKNTKTQNFSKSKRFLNQTST